MRKDGAEKACEAFYIQRTNNEDSYSFASSGTVCNEQGMMHIAQTPTGNYFVKIICTYYLAGFFGSHVVKHVAGGEGRAVVELLGPKSRLDLIPSTCSRGLVV